VGHFELAPDTLCKANFTFFEGSIRRGVCLHPTAFVELPVGGQKMARNFKKYKKLEKIAQFSASCFPLSS